MLLVIQYKNIYIINIAIISCDQGDNSKVIDAVVDVTNPFEITTVATQSRDSKYNNRFDYPLLLRLATPNDVYADAIISLLVQFQWHYISVVYESTAQMLDIYRELKIKSNFLGNVVNNGFINYFLNKGI